MICVKIVVTSGWAGEAFRKALRGAEVYAVPVLRLIPVEVDVKAVEEAVAQSDLVIFVSGRAAYRLKELGARLELTGKVVATAEGAKGAVMVKNAYGVEPQLVYDTSEDLAKALPGCRRGVVFHHGERAAELVEALKAKCPVAEFYTYRAVPDEDAINSIPPADVYVFFSALAAEAVGERRPELIKGALAVAAGPAVERVLLRYGAVVRRPPRGRIGDVVEYVKRLLEELR